MFLNFLLALLPIIWLFVAFLALKMPGYLGCLIALAISVAESVVLGAVNGGTAGTVMLHRLNLGGALTACLEGLLGAVLPFTLIAALSYLIPAVLIGNFVGAEFVDLVGNTLSLVAMIIAAKLTPPWGLWGRSWSIPAKRCGRPSPPPSSSWPWQRSWATPA